MEASRYVHVVDYDEKRRTIIARGLYSKGVHVEIYDGIREFCEKIPFYGVVLASAPTESDVAELFRSIRAAVGYLPVGMFAASPSATQIVQAMREGAVTYLDWPLATEEIACALDDLARRGEQYVARARRNAECRAAVSSLSRREVQVLRELIAGASSKQIGRSLGISPRTVDIHRGHMMSKLDVHSVADIVRIGIYAGIDGFDLAGAGESKVGTGNDAAAATADRLALSSEKLRSLLALVRAVTTRAKPRTLADVSQDEQAAILDGGARDREQQGLRAFVDHLNAQERIDLVSLIWLGRGDAEMSEWPEIRSEAASAHVAHSVDYLSSILSFDDFLERGLEAYGLSL